MFKGLLEHTSDIQNAIKKRLAVINTEDHTLTEMAGHIIGVTNDRHIASLIGLLNLSYGQ